MKWVLPLNFITIIANSWWISDLSCIDFLYVQYTRSTIKCCILFNRGYGHICHATSAPFRYVRNDILVLSQYCRTTGAVSFQRNEGRSSDDCGLKQLEVSTMQSVPRLSCELRLPSRSLGNYCAGPPLPGENLDNPACHVQAVFSYGISATRGGSA
jgi:hypothetical protein